MSIENDQQKVEEPGSRFIGFRIQEINGFLYRLGFSSNGSGLSYKKGLDGMHVLVVEAGKIYLHIATGRRSNCVLSDSNWNLIKGAFQRGWKIFVIVCIARHNLKDFNAKRCKKQKLVDVSEETRPDHVVALEICRDSQQERTHTWHLHNHELINGARKPRKTQHEINVFRTYTHKYIRKRLGVKISLQYKRIDDIGIPAGCSLYVLWVIQEALKGRMLPSLTSNPNLARLFLEKCNLVRYPDDKNLLQWKWQKWNWKYESILDMLSQDKNITWAEVVKLKAKVRYNERRGRNAGITDDNDDDDMFEVKTWKPNF